MKPDKSSRLSFAEREIKILTAATKVFSKNGYTGSTTKKIALESSVNEALIFRHFKTKRILYQAVLEFIVQKKNKRIQQQIATTLLHSDPRKALYKTAKIIYNENKANPELIRALYFAGLEDHKLVQEFFKKEFPLIDILNQALLRWTSKKNKISHPVSNYSHLYLSLIHQMIVKRTIFKSQFGPHQSVQNELQLIIDTFCQGVL